MTVVLIIICVILFIWISQSKKDIDEKEKVVLKTPGRANRLRENYGEVVDLILQDKKH